VRLPLIEAQPESSSPGPFAANCAEVGKIPYCWLISIV
jgi:hypothetical protein